VRARPSRIWAAVAGSVTTARTATRPPQVTHRAHRRRRSCEVTPPSRHAATPRRVRRQIVHVPLSTEFIWSLDRIISSRLRERARSGCERIEGVRSRVIDLWTEPMCGSGEAVSVRLCRSWQRAHRVRPRARCGSRVSRGATEPDRAVRRPSARDAAGSEAEFPRRGRSGALPALEERSGSAASRSHAALGGARPRGSGSAVRTRVGRWHAGQIRRSIPAIRSSSSAPSVARSERGGGGASGWSLRRASSSRVVACLAEWSP
jgi:hypothetical protein